MATDFKRMFPLLVGGGVEFVLVGGVAAVAHGSARWTPDVDVVHARSPKNLYDRFLPTYAEPSPCRR